MSINTECLIEACKNLHIPYKLVDNKSNLVEIKTDKFYYFVNNAVPINSATASYICNDKGFTYKILADSVKMPLTYSYLDPKCSEIYSEYLTFHSIDEIIKDIISKLNFPMIIKRNSGSFGINVFLCKNIGEVENSLKIIFDQKTKEYDYVALAQEYIPIKKEYRIIILNKKIELIYEKDISHAKFIGNLSPLHFQGAKTILIKDSDLILKTQQFVNQIFDKFDIAYAGLDIITDQKDNFYLIELNSKPRFDFFVRDNGKDILIELYKKILLLIVD